MCSPLKPERIDKPTLKNGLRVCFFSSFPPSRARLSEYAYPLINELQRLPQISHIDVIADTYKNHAVQYINDKLSIYRIWNGESILSLLLILPKLLVLKPDIVHFNLHMAVFGRSRINNFIGLCLPFFSRILGFKSVVTLHNLVEMIDIDRTGLSNTTLNRAGALIATKMITFASAVTLTVQFYLRILKGRYGCKNVSWVPHGTWDVDRINYQHHNPKNILFIGFSGPYKDLDLLFSTFKILRDRRTHINLIIAGSSHPNYPDYLKKFRSEKLDSVKFVGYVPDSKLSSLFQETELVVLPYHTCTGTSGVAHLVSSYGLPIVATNQPEFRDLIKEGCGIILSPHDPSEFAKKIEYILDNPDILQELRKRNLSFAYKRTWNKIAKDFLQVYENIEFGKILSVN